jgi:hypothetical protein
VSFRDEARRLNWKDLTQVMMMTGDPDQLAAVEDEMRQRPECDPDWRAMTSSQSIPIDGEG